jgi:hypothetical protein
MPLPIQTLRQSGLRFNLLLDDNGEAAPSLEKAQSVKIGDTIHSLSDQSGYLNLTIGTVLYFIEYPLIF